MHDLPSLRAICEYPHLHIPRLVRSTDLKGGRLDGLADAVGAVIGDMRLFLALCAWIACWLVAGTWYHFDPSPYPLLLMLVNLPQLPLMVSLQVSANRAEKQRDAKALADHETLTALHALSVAHGAILRRLDPGEEKP